MVATDKEILNFDLLVIAELQRLSQLQGQVDYYQRLQIAELIEGYEENFFVCIPSSERIVH
jgi:hypothetical protein